MHKNTLINLIPPANSKDRINFDRSLKSKHKEIHSWIMDKTSFLVDRGTKRGETIRFLERVYCVLNDIDHLLLCPASRQNIFFVNLEEGYEKFSRYATAEERHEYFVSNNLINDVPKEQLVDTLKQIIKERHSGYQIHIMSNKAAEEYKELKAGILDCFGKSFAEKSWVFLNSEKDLLCPDCNNAQVTFVNIHRGYGTTCAPCGYHRGSKLIMKNLAEKILPDGRTAKQALQDRSHQTKLSRIDENGNNRYVRGALNAAKYYRS